jgi:benzoylformate decarboxylase
MYSIQGLWSAAELRLPVAFVIVRNGSYRALDDFGEHFGLTRLPGTALPHLDFCALARGQGVTACRVARCADLDQALATAFAASEPVLVEVAIEDVASRAQMPLGNGKPT